MQKNNTCNNIYICIRNIHNYHSPEKTMEWTEINQQITVLRGHINQDTQIYITCKCRKISDCKALKFNSNSWGKKIINISNK